MNKDYLKELIESVEDAEIVEDGLSKLESSAGTINYANKPNMEEFLKCKFLKYSEMEKINSTKHGSNPKAVKARRKKNKNKKTHRK